MSAQMGYRGGGLTTVVIIDGYRPDILGGDYGSCLTGYGIKISGAGVWVIIGTAVAAKLALPALLPRSISVDRYSV